MSALVTQNVVVRQEIPQRIRVMHGVAVGVYPNTQLGNKRLSAGTKVTTRSMANSTP